MYNTSVVIHVIRPTPLVVRYFLITSARMTQMVLDINGKVEPAPPPKKKENKQPIGCSAQLVVLRKFFTMNVWGIFCGECSGEMSEEALWFCSGEWFREGEGVFFHGERSRRSVRKTVRSTRPDSYRVLQVCVMNELGHQG